MRVVVLRFMVRVESIKHVEIVMREFTLTPGCISVTRVVVSKERDRATCDNAKIEWLVQEIGTWTDIEPGDIVIIDGPVICVDFGEPTLYVARGRDVVAFVRARLLLHP